MLTESKDVFDMTGDNAVLSSVIERTKYILDKEGRDWKPVASEMMHAENYADLTRIVERELQHTHIVLSETQI